MIVFFWIDSYKAQPQRGDRCIEEVSQRYQAPAGRKVCPKFQNTAIFFGLLFRLFYAICVTFLMRKRCRYLGRLIPYQLHDFIKTEVQKEFCVITVEKIFKVGP